MILVSWNCRDPGNPSKLNTVKDLLIIETPDILLLQETKIDEETLLLLSITKWKKNVGIAVSVRGSSGGLATLWSKEDFSLKNYFATQHWIFTEIHHLQSKLTFSLFNLYVHVTMERKKTIGTLLQI